MEIGFRNERVTISSPTGRDMAVSVAIGLGCAGAIAGIGYAIVGPNGLMEKTAAGGLLTAGGSLVARSIAIRTNRLYAISKGDDQQNPLFDHLNSRKERGDTSSPVKEGYNFSIENQAAYSSFADIYLKWAAGEAILVCDDQMKSWRQVADHVRRHGWQIGQQVKEGEAIEEVLEVWDEHKSAPAQ